MNDMPKIPVDLENKILALQAATVARLPSMPNILQDIWNALKQQPENVTLLEEEQINIVFQGLEAQTNTRLVEIAVKSTKSKSVASKLKNLSVDDI